MPVSEHLKPAILDEIADDGTRSLFVLNNAAQIRGLRDGITIFNITVNNNNRVIRVPNTHVPIDIGLQLPKAELLNAPDLLEAVGRRILLLVSTASAKKYFEENIDGSQEELDRVNQELNGRLVEREIAMPFNPEMGQSATGELDPELNMQMAEAVSREDISEGELLGVVRRLDLNNGLKRKDFEFIVATTQWPKVKAFATNKLSTLPRRF